MEKFYSIFSEDFINKFLKYTSITVDQFSKRNPESNKYEIFFERILFSNEYCNEKYDFHFQHKAFRVHRSVYPKLYFLTYEKNEVSIKNFIDLYKSCLEKEYNIKVFNPARHGDWPGYSLLRNKLGSEIIIASPDKEIPDNIYKLMESDDAVYGIHKEDEVAKISFDKQFNIDLGHISRLQNSFAFIFLNDSASITDWKIYKNPENKAREGIHINLFISDLLYPFPKLELECILLAKDNKTLLNIRKTISSEYELSHSFECDNDGEIYTCITKLYENDILIDDYSGVPTRYINCSFEVSSK